MKAYSFDSKGLFSGMVDRQYDQLDKCWLMPAGATDKEPFFETGFVPVWNGEFWKLEKDNSGAWYNTDNKQQVILNPLDDTTGLTKLVPPEGFYKWSGKQWIKDDDAQKIHDNDTIHQELDDIDRQRVRPLAEINNPDIVDKSFAVRSIEPPAPVHIA